MTTDQMRDLEQAHQVWVGQWQAQLEALHGRIAARFKRLEVRERVRHFLAALLDDVERKNSWQLAEQMGEAHPAGVQRLLRTAKWEVDGVRDDLRGYVSDELGDPEGVGVVDETGFLKKGRKSVGVKRQYSGTAGRVENSQVGVFLAYSSANGRAFLDRRLYLPEEWATDPVRRAEAGVPTDVRFATKPELAEQMLADAFAAGVPMAWVTGDEVYGNASRLRAWLEAEHHSYVLAVATTHEVWLAGTDEEPVAVAVGILAEALPERAWMRLSAGEGSKGPRWYDWACVRLPFLPTAGRAKWVLVRRSIAKPDERAYYRVFGPVETTLPQMVRVAGQRWVIEEVIERAKGEVGLDQYEVRTWEGWHRHLTLALLAHALLEVTRAQTNTALATGERGASSYLDPVYSGRTPSGLAPSDGATPPVDLPPSLVSVAARPSGQSSRLPSAAPVAPLCSPQSGPRRLNVSL
jgi:SRSO17 transposase